MENNYTTNYFKCVSQGLEETVYKTPNGDADKEVFFTEITSLTKELKKNDGRIFFIGNGASAAFSNHMALDWSKNGGIYATSLSDSALLTALSNDYSYESAFVEFLKINNVNPNDLIVTVSSSGNSGNIVNVLDYCKANKITTFALSGLKHDNASVDRADYSLYVPRKTYGLVECIHQIFLHLWLDMYMGVQDWARDTYQNMDASNFNL